MPELTTYDCPSQIDDAALGADLELLQAVVGACNEVVTVLDLEGRYRFVSEASERSLGWQPADLVGRLALDIVHPEDKPMVARELELITQPPHNPRTLRFRFAQKDGDWRLMESRGRVLQRPGKPSLLIAHSSDITERENTDQALRDSEERYRKLIDNSPDAIIAHSDGVIIFANAAAAELFAAESPEAFIGRRAAEIIHPDDLAGMRERVQKALAQGQHAPLREERMMRLNGEEIWVEAKGVHTMIKGQPSIQAVIRDVSARRAAMQAEQRRAQATRLLYEIASQAESNIDHQLTQALSLAASLLGMESATISECDSSSCYLTHHHGPAHTAATTAPLPLSQTYCHMPMTKGELVAISDITNSEYARHAAVKRMPQQSYIGMPLQLHNGQSGVLGFTSAVAKPQGFDQVDCDLLRMMSRWVEFALDRRNASNAIEAANRDLSRSNEELQQFAYIASHDLKEPLRSITTYLQLLVRRYGQDLNEEALEFMGFAVTGAKRMQNLIQDLLEFSRTGNYSGDAGRVSLGATVDHALTLLGEEIQASGAQITHDPLPEVSAHEGLLQQLLQNLIINAIKFRHPEKPPRIHVRAHAVDDFWRIEVVDNGMGIAAEHRERIFQMFRRLHTHEKYEGTGIGLAIAKRIVERHGGQIGVQDADTGGSCFYFTLPRE